ncbi:MAG: hypothetical protein AAGF71_12875 [Pseudomonadota bacterium]
MTPLQYLRRHGGRVSRHKWTFRLHPGRVSRKALARLQDPLVLHRLRTEVWPEYEDWLERAAIREFCGGQSRTDAERDAFTDIIERSDP